MMKIITIAATIFLTATNLIAQHQPASSSYYKNQMTELNQAIRKNFYDPSSGFYRETTVVEPGKNAFSYLWPVCGLIQAGNEVKKVDEKDTLMQHIISILPYYYDASPPAPGYASYIMKFKGGDRFYDDNQWIGIACMDAYGSTIKALYLQTGKLIYQYMMTGYDTVLQGGLYWQETKKVSKNTCSNGPGIILALQLYKATSNQHYLDTAFLLYNWVNTKLKAPSGLYYDNMRLNGTIGTHFYSYNTGTMLQSAVYLYEITKEPKYLNEAVTIADSAANYFLGSGKFRDSYWFNAVLLRGFQHLLLYKKDMKYILAFKTCLDNALQDDKNETGVMGKSKPQELVSQSAMLEILARFAWLEKQYTNAFRIFLQ